jgi:hypothetical protein
MMWALLLLLAVVAGVHWWEYRSSVQEYSFAQPSAGLSGVLAEKSPVVFEVGVLPWRQPVAESSSWTMANGQSVGDWLKTTGLRDIPSEDGMELAKQMELTTGLTEIDGARAWWWLPGLRDTAVSMCGPGAVRGLRWVSAEREWIGCSHGDPITVWLVHSRYRRFLPSVTDVNPWALTVSDAPWIGRVQYVEVIVKPGWCLGVPAHWGFAVKGSDLGSDSASDKKEAESESWIWSTEQHSVASFLSHA